MQRPGHIAGLAKISAELEVGSRAPLDTTRHGEMAAGQLGVFAPEGRFPDRSWKTGGGLPWCAAETSEAGTRQAFVPQSSAGHRSRCASEGLGPCAEFAASGARPPGSMETMNRVADCVERELLDSGPKPSVRGGERMVRALGKRETQWKRELGRRGRKSAQLGGFSFLFHFYFFLLFESQVKFKFKFKLGGSSFTNYICAIKVISLRIFI